MRLLLYLFLVLSPFLKAQNHSIYIEFCRNYDQNCTFIYAANGKYELPLNAEPKIKIPDAVWVDPSLTHANQTIQLGAYQVLMEKFAFDNSMGHHRYYGRKEADSIVRVKNNIGFNNYYVLSKEEVQNEGFIPYTFPYYFDRGERIADKLWYCLPPRAWNAKWATDRQLYGRGPIAWPGVIDGVYISDSRAYDREETYFQAFPEKRDSVENAHHWIRKNKLSDRVESIFEPFWMSDHEVTNKEYREFVNWVRDSIARDMIYFGLENDDEATEYLQVPKTYEEWVDVVCGGHEECDEFEPSDRDLNREILLLNWDKEFDYHDPKIVPLVAEIYYPNPERFYARREFDVRKFNYRLLTGIEINVYPDTTNFLQMTDSIGFLGNCYFWHPAFDDYPVVNLSYQQMIAYCTWKQDQLNKELKRWGEDSQIRVDIPTISQYEFALKQVAETGTRNDIYDQPNDQFSPFQRDSGWVSFLHKTKLTKKELKSMDRTFFNWYSSRNTGPIYDLVGNVSEVVSDRIWDEDEIEHYDLEMPSFRDQKHYVMGPNFHEGVSYRGDAPFNELFFKKIRDKKQSSFHTGFRLVYTLE